MAIDEIDDSTVDLDQPSTAHKQINMDDFIIVTDIVTEVTGYDTNNEAFHNARKNDILPLLKALKLVEYMDRKYYIQLGTKDYCIELLKDIMFKDKYIELSKSLKKQTLSEVQTLELSNLKREVSYRVYSPLPYYHDTEKGDFEKIKEQINFELLENMVKIQGFKLYKSEVLYIEAMKNNINRFLDALQIQSEEYIQHLHDQENQMLLSILTNHSNPELNGISIDLKRYTEKYPDNPTYKRLYSLLHEELYDNLEKIHSAPINDFDLDDHYNDENTEITSNTNNHSSDIFLHEEDADDDSGMEVFEI